MTKQKSAQELKDYTVDARIVLRGPVTVNAESLVDAAARFSHGQFDFDVHQCEMVDFDMMGTLKEDN